MKTYLYRSSNLKSTITFLALVPQRKSISGCPPKTVDSCDLFILIRECSLYVGLARAVSPTNTNFRLTFLVTRFQEAIYEDLAV